MASSRGLCLLSSVPPRLREVKGLLDVALLSASRLCCDWNHISLDAALFVSFCPFCVHDHCGVGLCLSILFFACDPRRNLAAEFVLV